MEEFYLRVRAPFAAFRTFQAGVFRTSSPVMPHSAAFGLILNLAGIEMREVQSLYEPTTRIRQDVPCLRIAVGSKKLPEKSSLFQQLHTYPVGNSGEHLEPKTKGAKYWIVTARREILVGLDCVLGVQSSEELGLFNLVQHGLRGEITRSYGLPFAGDNNFLFDRIEVFRQPCIEARWYAPLKSGEPSQKGSCQLTIGINRTDNSKTTSKLFAPTPTTMTVPPDDAWVWTPSHMVQSDVANKGN
jgi:CRISPR-associated protein Cas5t